MSPKHTDESYEDTLARLDVPIEAQADRRTLLKYLEEELGITNPDFAESIWKSVEPVTAMAEHGIFGVTIKYPWGVEVRYGIQGMSGLWNFASVQAIRAGEEW
jgi:hypothetical protein